MWLMDAARAAVQGLDPSVPYILSDVVSFCSPNASCKVHTVCSLPRNAPTSTDTHDAQTCVRSPPAVPCTPAALSAPGVCKLGPPAAGFPWPCGRNGALISRGLMHALNASYWRECESSLPTTGGGDIRLFRCIRDAGFTVTDPTPGDDPSFCAMGFAHPAELLAMAQAATNGTCDTACERMLTETISLSLDHVGARPAAARELSDALLAARAALDSRSVSKLADALNADIAALVAARAAAGALPGGLVATLTSGNSMRWRMFRNWLSHAVALRTPLLVITTDARTQMMCELALEHVVAPPFSVCFFPRATLERHELGHGSGEDAWHQNYWRRVAAVAKPIALALAFAAAGPGGDVLFAETDVVLRGNALLNLAARGANATMTCAVATHDKGTLPGANVGVLFLRGADARLAPLLRAHVLRCAPRWMEVDDQGELVAALMRVQDTRSLLPDVQHFFDCVDSSDGYTTSCCGFNASAAFTVHAAGPGAGDSKSKIEWLQHNGLWLESPTASSAVKHNKFAHLHEAHAAIAAARKHVRTAPL